MTDIIERLKDWEEYDEGRINEMREEAAEKIKMLRGHNKSLQYDFEQIHDEYKRLDRAMKIAAGLISTMEGHSHKHPQDVYKWLVKEAS